MQDGAPRTTRTTPPLQDEKLPAMAKNDVHGSPNLRLTSSSARPPAAAAPPPRRRRASLATSYRGPSLLATHQMGRLSPLAVAVAAPQPDRGVAPECHSPAIQSTHCGLSFAPAGALRT
ncbi:hypothetical protein TsFJ059_006616 [Trichoderma semiorbis]|uniref:Uncharacterized protein n=1 Tax=Trichoderma semiorbis TaxID=1491008 RepID=A0A9P8HJU3_9HYPO|nr:hypothetical protein TsFJ059_006616 [Trichoderma semiorbis]